MRILQIGVPKSGNFWLYSILQEVVARAGIGQRSFIENQPIYELAQDWDLPTSEHAGIDALRIEPNGCFYQIWPIFRWPIEDMDNYVCQCSHTWSHSAFCEGALEVLSKFDKVVYILRDPRDVALSQSRFIFTPFIMKHCPHSYGEPSEHLDSRLDALIRDWVEHVGGYLKRRDSLDIHFVFYERLLHTFESELTALLTYLEVGIDEECAIEGIQRAVSFKSMRRENPDHVRKGRSGEWAKVLTDRQKQRAAKIGGSMLEILNYPDDGVGKGTHNLPCLPVQVECGSVDRAVDRARGSLVRRGAKGLYSFLMKHGLV